MKRRQASTTYLTGEGLKEWRRAPRAASRRGSRHLFDRWSEVSERLQAARHITLLLDFDGTIVPIRPRPEMVRLSSRARRLIGRLAQHPKVTVCIVSGRRLADLRRRANVSRVIYLGLHGWEQDELAPRMTGPTRILQRAKELIEERLSGLKGIRVEDKGFNFAVHYRGAVSDVVRHARPIVCEIIGLFQPSLRLLEGKKVWEVLPREVKGKGDGVRALLAKLPSRGLPIYIGDDATDESAFQVLHHGITVRVGRSQNTKARFCVRNPQEVLHFLHKLEAEIV